MNSESIQLAPNIEATIPKDENPLSLNVVEDQVVASFSQVIPDSEIKIEKNENSLSLANNIEAKADQVQEQVVEEISDFKLEADLQVETAFELKEEVAIKMNDNMETEALSEIGNENFNLESDNSPSAPTIQAEMSEGEEMKLATGEENNSSNDNLESLMNSLFAEGNENDIKKEET